MPRKPPKNSDRGQATLLQIAQPAARVPALGSFGPGGGCGVVRFSAGRALGAPGVRA